MKLSKTSIIILLTFVVSLFFFVKVVNDKETTILKGKLVYLELAPIDPRSLIQGDYMALNYAIQGNRWQFDSGTEIDSINLPSRGYVLLAIDQNNIGTFVDRKETINVVGANQLKIKYFNGTKWSYNIGAESYFFQEGEGKKYEKAKYGGLRVDDKGNSVLIGLFDEKLKQIK
ncbi:MAG: GDYXXLXY domain-containing protein [Flavobacteriaceae bacterium]|jgi:uncharacterized membrane-anchored protein|nr:GDYXXLXY domain-containing protein [Flavobacteriaceae bacterium]